MKCEDCGKNEAVGYSETIINGVRTHKYLCGECMRRVEREVFSSTLTDPLSGLFSGLFGVESPSKLPHGRMKCSKCRTTLAEIVGSGYVGCPDCYAELGEELEPYIKSVQGSTMHIGTMPSPMGESGSASEIDRLREELKKAVEVEDYELAQQIHNKLTAMKEGKNDK